jgi:hypothetical protein
MPDPGVSREQRISDEGLKRLEKQFNSGVKPSSMVLKQWIKRYGESARDLIKNMICIQMSLMIDVDRNKV